MILEPGIALGAGFILLRIPFSITVESGAELYMEIFPTNSYSRGEDRLLEVKGDLWISENEGLSSG